MGSIITPILQCITSTLDFIYHRNNHEIISSEHENEKLNKKFKKIELIEIKNDKEFDELHDKIDKLEQKIGTIPVFSPIKSPRKKFK